MPILQENPTLSAYQQYVEELEHERGFIDQTVFHKCLLLGEEVGELFKAVRKEEGLRIDLNSKLSQISYELVDILIYLCAIANRYNIDLETAFREKEEINKARQWNRGI
jgi:NTP pyrophosphatase (non-canonical NTP hydrolase)